MHGRLQSSSEMLLTRYVDGLQARLQCVSGVVISLLTSVGQGLVPRCHCVSGIASHAPTQHFSVLPHNLTPIYGCGVIVEGFRCGWVPPPSPPCSLSVPISVLTSRKGGWLAVLGRVVSFHFFLSVPLCLHSSSGKSE